MFDPKDIMTEVGMREWDVHLFNMEKALFYLTEHADDLHIGCHDDRQIALLYELQDMLDVYRKGDGEKEEVE